MRTIFAYISVTFTFLVRTFSFRLKYKMLKNSGKQKEAEDFLLKTVRELSSMILRRAGVKLDVSGLENIPKGPCCFIANHQGYFDILAILSSINKPMGFIAKKEMEKIPILSTWMKNIKCVFINRENVKEGLKSINQGAENIKNGHSMVIFPEGRRSKEHSMGKFRNGSLKMATKANAPIVPIAIDGSYKIFEQNNGWIKGGIIKLSIGKPIYVDKLSREEIRQLPDRVRSEIEKNLMCISENE